MKPETFTKLTQEIKEIAEFLENSSIKDEFGIYWNQVDDTEDNGKIPKNETIYDGNAGICLFLIELYNFEKSDKYLKLVEESSRWIYHYSRKKPNNNYAFYTGRVGTAYVLALCGQLLNNDDYLSESLKISLEAISDFNNPIIKYDFLSGLAGTLIGLMQIHEIMPNPSIYEGVLTGAAKLINLIQLNKNGIFWEWKYSSIAPLCGLSHGNAGYAFTFLELSKFLNDDSLLLIASVCYQYENRHFREGINNWPDYRSKEKNGVPTSANNERALDCATWCHGAPGIGLTRQLLLENCNRFGSMKGLKVGNALEKTYQSTKKYKIKRPSLNLCHGIAGNAFIFFNQKGEKTKYTNAVEEFAELILFAKKENDGYYSVFTSLNGSINPGLFLGVAGIGYFFIYALNNKENSILLPTIKRREFSQTKIKFINLFVEVVLKKMYPENSHKMKAEVINNISDLFVQRHKEGKIANQILFLKKQFEDVLKESYNAPSISFSLEKYKLKLMLENTLDLKDGEKNELDTGLLSLDEHEMRKQLDESDFVLNSNYVQKAFGKNNELKYYLFAVNLNTVTPIEINQFQSILLAQFGKPITFKKAYEQIGEYIDIHTEAETTYDFILKEFVFMYQKQIIKMKKTSTINFAVDN